MPINKKAETLAAEAKAEKAVSKALGKVAAKVEKAPVRKRAAAVRKAVSPKVSLYVQYQGRQISEAEAVAAVLDAWTGDPVETLDLYVKPEDGAVYYVVNGGEGGKVEF